MVCSDCQEPLAGFATVIGVQELCPLCATEWGATLFAAGHAEGLRLGLWPAFQGEEVERWRQVISQEIQEWQQEAQRGQLEQAKKGLAAFEAENRELRARLAVLEKLAFPAGNIL